MKKIALICILTFTFAFSSSVSAANLLVNGGFEEPAVSNWGVFPDGTSGLGWTPSIYDSAAYNWDYPVVEIQSNLFGQAYEGNQYAELDSYGSTLVSQSVPTTAGCEYNLSYAWSPRPGVSDNNLKVYINSTEVPSLAITDVSGSFSWTSVSYAFTADSSATNVGFSETLPSDQLGMFIDGVSLEIIDNDQDGYAVCQGDCDDDNASINPEETEICGDEIDNNCNGEIDEDCGICPAGYVQEVAPLETLNIACAPRTLVTSSNSLTGGASYVLEASGTCNWRTFGSSGGYLADAEYWLRHDAYGEGWTKMSPWSIAFWNGSTAENIDWGAYNESHTYPIAYSPSASGKATFYFYDDAYTDNSGSLQVAIYQCVPECQPTTEICDNIDNDCDGAVDEDLNQQTTNQNGECADNTETCVAGNWISDESNYQPSAEICNGLDDNCDGNIDENLTAPLSGEQDGVCSGSVKICDGTNGWIEPTLTDLPYYEETETRCDTLDNNCDGEIDEGGVCEFLCVTPANDTEYLTLGLGVNRLVYDGQSWITKLPKGKATTTVLTLTLPDTHNCGCEQILTWLHENLPETYGEMNGHWKYGCSQSAIQDFMRLTQINTFDATESFYYNGPTDQSGLYGSGPIVFTWNPSFGNVTGGYYTEQVPANTGTFHYNIITGGTVNGDNVTLQFSRVNPNIYNFGFSGTLTGNVLTGYMDGNYLFTATGTITP